MATYPGMSLGGEVRESVSLDEDDMSDVEDEVFIRDGKNGYKFAEDIGVKRPLMAPRRKIVKPDFRSRLKYRPPWCRWCKPLCFILAILVVLTGVLVLGIILVSMFPLPIDKIKNWITTKTQKNVTVKLLPCSDLNITDVWSTSLPKLTSESSIRSVDIDVDGVMDVIFGFGTGDNSALHPDIFCPMFMGVASPCGGGLIALNGANGNIIWKKHLAHTIFTVFCSADLNGDSVSDCIAAGKGGILVAVNAKNGDILWEFNDKKKDNHKIMDLYTPNFIPDQNNDGVGDIIAVHTSQKGRSRTGHIFLISGKTGDEIRSISTPNGIETYCIPQLLPQKNGQYKVLFGTGSPTSAGNLSIFDLNEFVNGNASVNFKTLYQDTLKGVLSPSILVDITGDEQVDIITALFNSTVVAIDGATFQQIWNISVNDSETLSTPTPGYFNGDNVTDFLVKYQTGPEFPVYYYSQVHIIDGKTGKFIYDSPIVDSVGSQMGGLTLGMEGFGFDFFTYWIADCKYYEGRQDAYEFLVGSDLKDQSNADLCKLRFNSTKVTKLFALNQFDQPPGLEIYSSENRTTIEFNNTKTPTQEATEYLKKHPEVQVGEAEQRTPSSEVVEVYKQAPEPIKKIKYNDGSPFRHKDNNQGLVKDFSKTEKTNFKDDFDSPDYEQQSNWRPKLNYPNYLPGDIDDNYETDGLNIYNPNNQMIINDAMKNGNRGTRDGSTDTEVNPQSSKKNLSDNKYNIYNYNNVREARNRILNDLNSVPTEILKDTFLKNREQELRKSRLEQRDLNSHIDKLQENKEMQHVLIDEEKKLANVSENLWDLESEKELEERKNGYWRGKREINKLNIKGIQKITSMGTLVKAVGVENKNAVDLIFLTYWLPPKTGPQILIDKDYDCIAAKVKNALNSKDDLLQSEKLTIEDLYKKECLLERVPVVKDTIEDLDVKIPYFNQMSHLRLGQMTVYKIRLECVCSSVGVEEKCAKFLEPEDTKGWSEFLGRAGDGIFSRS